LVLTALTLIEPQAKSLQGITRTRRAQVTHSLDQVRNMAAGTLSENTTSDDPVAEACPAARLLANAGEMTLRVHAPKHEPREVRIRSPKCTIGSAAGCTLRLRARGVDGLHCWILRGPQGSIIRRLHGSTMLNGAQFDEAPIRIGDRLRIGPVEVEIVECNQPPSAPQPMFSSVHDPSEHSAELQSKLDEALLQMKRLQTESRQAFQSSIVAAERADQLRDALALANDQLEEMYKEQAAAEETIDKTTKELEECRRQLNAQSEPDRHEGVALEQARQQAATAQQQCEHLTAELANTKVALSKEQESWHIERAELQRLIAQQAAELESARSSTVAQTCAVTIPIDKHSADDDAVRKELEAKIADLEQQLAFKQRGMDSLQEQYDDTSSQGGAMTIALHEKSTGDDAVRAQLESKLAGFEQQLAAKQGEIDALQKQLAEESAQGCAMTISLNERSKDDDAERKQLEGKLAEFEQQLAEKQGEIEELHERLDSHVAVQHRLERLAAEYDIKCRELEDVRSQLAAAGEKNSAAQQELEQQTEALLHREQELSQREVALTAAQQLFAQQQEQLQTERDRLAAIQEQSQVVEQQQSQLQNRAAELEAASAQAAARQAEWEELRKQLDEERAACETKTRELEQQRQELELQQQQVQARSQELDNQQRELQALAEQQAAVASRQTAEKLTAAGDDSVVAPGSAAAAPVNGANGDSGELGGVDNVLSRLVKAGLWRNDEPAGDEPEAGTPATRMQIPESKAESPVLPLGRADSNAQTDADEAAPHPSTDAIAPLAANSSNPGSEDESIESYMERLMKRMRGEEGSPKTAGAPPTAPVPVSSSPAMAEPAAPHSVAGHEQLPGAEPGEFSPRRAAPEVVASMSAMRDLANTAARSAIDQHVRKHTGQQATGRLIGACLTVALAAGLGYWAWKTHSLQAAAGAIIGGGLGAHWLLSAARRLFKLRRLNALDATTTAVGPELK
jgi:hypothetical protein